MQTYFASDGSYGDAENMVVLDTSNWTNSEFEILDWAQDEERAELAVEIDWWLATGYVRDNSILEDILFDMYPNKN